MSVALLPAYNQTSRLSTLIDEAKSIIEMCRLRGKKTVLMPLFSGGKDSIVSTHIASQMTSFWKVAYVNTHTGPLSQEHAQHVQAIAQEHGWEMLVGEPSTTYEMLVIKEGFPGPGSHSWMYRMLKERSIRKVMKVARKAHPGAAFLLPTGIRRSESHRRANVSEFTKKSQTEIWVNPLVSWRESDIRAYMNAHNLHVPAFRNSEDCKCGAFAQPGEREQLMQHPDQAAYISNLEMMVKRSRQLQLLQRKRDPQARVIPRKFCKWGHGQSGSTVDAPDPGAISICNDCTGQLDRDGNVGVDPDKMMQQALTNKNGAE